MDFNDISENSIRKILEFRNESIFQNEDYFLVIIRNFENITYSVALTAKKKVLKLDSPKLYWKRTHF